MSAPSELAQTLHYGEGFRGGQVKIFPVFERLLEKAVSRDQVASGSHVEATTAREAKDLIRELRDAFKAAGFTDTESKALIETVRGRGYRLGVPATEIVIEG